VRRHWRRDHGEGRKHLGRRVVNQGAVAQGAAIGVSMHLPRRHDQ
jgi:hypothetical protein